MRLSDLYVSRWQGDGIYSLATAGGGAGPTGGSGQDGELFINNTGSRGGLVFRSWDGGQPTQQATIFASNGPSGGWLFYDAIAGKHVFRHNYAAAAEINAGGIDLAEGKALSVAGTQVVGARGAAVADATDGGSAVTQLNALLARLRTHGLIAA